MTIFFSDSSSNLLTKKAKRFIDSLETVSQNSFDEFNFCPLIKEKNQLTILWCSADVMEERDLELYFVLAIQLKVKRNMPNLNLPNL